MKIRIVNHSRHSLPSYETVASAGMDIQEGIKNYELRITNEE
jgi:dUTPase